MTKIPEKDFPYANGEANSLVSKHCYSRNFPAEHPMSVSFRRWLDLLRAESHWMQRDKDENFDCSNQSPGTIDSNIFRKVC
jgi:hypothetical protein